MVRFDSEGSSTAVSGGNGAGRAGKVLLAANNDTHRDTVSSYLLTRGHSIVTVESHAAALVELHVGDVDMVVATLNDAEDDGVALMRAIRRTAPGLPIVLLTMTDDERTRRTIDSAIGMRGAGKDRSHDAAERITALSDREKQVVGMVVDGRSSRAIGLELSISCRTVENHRARVMAKLGVKNVAELVSLALRAKLVLSDDAAGGCENALAPVATA